MKIKYPLLATRYSLNSQNGFTLIESLVAIAVFTVGVSAAIFVVQQSIGVGARVKNKIIAANLAQEGLEVIHNIRDRNWIAGKIYNVADNSGACVSSGNCWTNSINDSDGVNNLVKTGCVQYDSASLLVDPDCALKPNLFFNNSNYVMDSNASIFQRTVSTEFSPAIGGEPERLKVTSTVTCGFGCSVALEEYLYNWK